MKISSKLWTAFAVGMVFVGLLIWLGFGQLTQFNQTLQDLTYSQYKKMDLTTTISANGNTIAKSIRDLVILDSSPTRQEEIIEEIRHSQREIDLNLSELVSITTNESAKDELGNLEEDYLTFNTFVEEIISDIENRSNLDVNSLFDEEGGNIQRDFFTTADQVNLLYEKGMEDQLKFSMEQYNQTLKEITFLGLLMLLVIIGFLIWFNRTLSHGLRYVSNVMLGFANGSDLSTRIKLNRKDEIGDVAIAFNTMAHSLEENLLVNEEQTWVKTNLAEITTKLQGLKSVYDVASTYIQTITPLIDGSQGVFYLKEEKENFLHLAGSYAFKERKHMDNRFEIGDGIVGQCALEKQPVLLTKVPSDYISIKSGLGEAAPLNIMVLPIIFEDEVLGVIEIASFHVFDPIKQALLEDTTKVLGIIMDSVASRARLAKTLEESQTLTEELQVQTEELATQQEELRKLNEELEEQTMELKASEESLQQQQQDLENINTELEEQNSKYEQKNKEVEMARRDLEQKAEQLELSSKYKSEFLANMSHELRTPLNSLLILAKLLMDNTQKNLSDKQLEFARTIHSSGKDLLHLINEILDLAKVESGKIEANSKQTYMSEVANNLYTSFSFMAEQKGISFNVLIDDQVPDQIYTDPMRLQQILGNLISNSLKFTHTGHVTVGVKMDNNNVMFSVTDTGIGIPKDKLSLIFEAFQQVDGSTSRKYGGTGLGLSISRELAYLLSGEIYVDSEEGKGSTFTLSLPVFEESTITIENKNVASTDFNVFDQSARLIQKEEIKPPSRKKMLIVEDNHVQRNSMMELLSIYPIDIYTAGTGDEALRSLKENRFECMVLDLGLKDVSGFELLKEIEKDPTVKPLKIIIYTGKELTLKDEIELNKYTNTIIIKDVMSPERLLQETARIFQMTSSPDSFIATSANQPYLEEVAVTVEDNNVLEGKKVLLVDDDVRNLFAVSSILEDYHMLVTFAENGKEALEILKQEGLFDVILTDIMMPDMDGYETMKEIRKDARWKSMPLIALTAKAMKDDKDKCIAAGASDYISKPVDPDQLISLLKVWLYGQGVK